MQLEIHILQSFPPANLNRDENGMPKSCVFGGRNRARISSQCQKRATRLYYHKSSELDPNHYAQRSRAWMPKLQQALQTKDISESNALVAAKLSLAVLGAVVEEDRIESKTILFLGQTEIESITSLLVANWEKIEAGLAGEKPTLPKNIEKGIEKALVQSGKPGDVALFGRMMASLPAVNVDAAVQVAHAIGVNTLEQEFDFFTAVDDLSAGDDQGADHMGETGYNSSTYYRFAVLDTKQLIGNLGSSKDVTKIAHAFAEAFVKAIPSGHQSAFAAHSLPAAVIAVVRSGQPVSLVDAFEDPIRPSNGLSLLEKSVKALDAHWLDLKNMYGNLDVQYVGVVTRSRLQDQLKSLKDNTVESLNMLLDSAIATAFNGGR